MTVLSMKTRKLLILCDAEGLTCFADLVAAAKKQCCPAICATEGCDHITVSEPNEYQGRCRVCGGTTMVSLAVLAGLKGAHGHER